MKPISRAEAVDYANHVLAAEDSTSVERNLARYVLAMETLVASFVQDAEQAQTVAMEAALASVDLDSPCSVCGWRVMGAADVTEAMRRHDELVQRKELKPHALTLEQEPGRFLMLTENTIREIERPSGQAADRDSTGGNDPYSNA